MQRDVCVKAFVNVAQNWLFWNQLSVSCSLTRLTYKPVWSSKSKLPATSKHAYKNLKLSTQHNSQLQTKVLDLEACSHGHNIKIVGIQEGKEDGKPTESIFRLIPKLLREEHFPHPLKVDHAHRSLQPKPATGAKPRTILACIHHFQVKELILWGTRHKGSLDLPRHQWGGLRDRGVKHTLRYPARLTLITIRSPSLQLCLCTWWDKEREVFAKCS